ncbi:MAG: NUDIX hydrolase [Metallosphaera sp.]|uniref:NUDIX hydrolase n=1 Tax=Metallosphaera cuprina (strain Ar-4) TaxID=1006006 RepID=F4FYH9_METCR|nr:NUDIX hydrolase [Metallosphaera cuprina]AEB95477.1 NUDIX hydrolase [Metallosphaera cuprina Ar-4]
MKIFSGKKFEVHVEKVSLPNGKERQLEYVKHRGSVVLVPLLEDKVIMIKQYRPVIGKWIYEFPAGTIDEGEDPETTAKRELIEETGYEAGSLTKLLSFYPSPGITNEVMHLYLASDLKYVGARPEEYEVIKVEPMEFKDLENLVINGSIEDGKTIIGVLYVKYKGVLNL